MANAFNKEERVAFEQMLEGFNDALVLSRAVNIQRFSDSEMERASNIMWRPMPYIARSFSGLDQTGNFGDSTQLSVPATLGFTKSVPWQMSLNDLRDALQENRLGQAAYQKLASDINVSVANVAALEGTIFVKRTAAAAGFDDVAQCDAAMNEIGVQMDGRNLMVASRDYNNMAKDLANRGTLTGKPVTAYERALVGENIAGFRMFKGDYGVRVTLAAGVTVTVNGANQRYVPKATSTAGTGETSNVDNRYQNLTITVSSGTVKVGDRFTIAGVNSVHLLTKQDTGQLKTFVIKSIVSGGGGSGVVQISPPIIAADSSPTAAETMYKNVTATPANGAAITFLNTATAVHHPFWHQSAIELLPGRYSPSQGAGIDVLRGTTDQGIEILFSKQAGIDAMNTKFRCDVFYGVCMVQPEMAGAIAFSQP